MRKLFWCCTAAAVVTAGGLFLAADHACRHPDSAVGRCVLTGSEVVMLLNPFAAGSTAAERVRHAWHGEGSAESEALAGSAEEDIPDDPVPVDQEPAGEPEPVLEGVAVGPAAVGGVIEMAGQGPCQPPAAIVIPEEDLEPAAAAQGEAVLPPPAASDLAPAEPFPMAMPYCADEDVTPKSMSYAYEDDKDPAAAEPRSSGHAWKFGMGLFRSDTHGKKSTPGDSEDCEAYEPLHAPACEPLPAPDYEPLPAPACEEDCPHGKGCSPKGGMRGACTVPAQTPGKDEAGAEPAATPKEKHTKVLHRSPKGYDRGEDCPTHPEIDTMEFRPSDGKLNEYGPGPL
jgi:hypothetical protein